MSGYCPNCTEYIGDVTGHVCQVTTRIAPTLFPPEEVPSGVAGVHQVYRDEIASLRQQLAQAQSHSRVIDAALKASDAQVNQYIDKVHDRDAQIGSLGAQLLEFQIAYPGGVDEVKATVAGYDAQIAKLTYALDCWKEIAAEREKVVAALQSEVTHWKANHANEVQRAQMLKHRTDVPIERIKAYEEWGEDQKKLALAVQYLETIRDTGLTAEEAMQHARDALTVLQPKGDQT